MASIEPNPTQEFKRFRILCVRGGSEFVGRLISKAVKADGRRFAVVSGTPYERQPYFQHSEFVHPALSEAQECV